MLTLGEESLLHGAMKEARKLENLDNNDSHASVIRRLVDLVRYKDREILELERETRSMKRKARMRLPVF